MQNRLLSNVVVLCLILVSVLVLLVKRVPASPDDRGTTQSPAFPTTLLLGS